MRADALAEFLYHLVFPRRDYNKLPAHVKAAYLNDATRILMFIEEHRDA